MATYLISPKEACKRTSLTRPTLDRLIEEGTFPKPIRISERRIAFDEAAIEEWMQSKIQAGLQATN